VGVPSFDNQLENIDEIRARLLKTAPVDPPELDSAIEYLSGLDASRSASLALRRRNGRPLVQPRGGFARFEDQRDLTLALLTAGADFLPLTIDSHTRHNDYATVAVLLERSQLEDKNLLNGYPLVNYGHRVSRRLYDSVERPISLRHGTPDARLLVETALATGITEIEGGGLTYSLPYTRSYPISRALLHWQYVDRVCALVSSEDAPIHRESFGVLTATLVPPVMVVVVELCELLLAAEQGVRSFSVSYAQTGSLQQDLALSQVLRQASADYLSMFGFSDVEVFLVYHQWMGAFPRNPDLALSIIANSSQIASFVGADKIITKTKEEARGIPTITSNADAVRLVRYVLEHSDALGCFSVQELEEDADRLRKQVDAVMGAIFDLPPEPFWSSVSLAFDMGYIDIPFSPHKSNRNRLHTCRGQGNGVFISDPGLVPLPPELLVQESAAIEARVMRGASSSLFDSLMEDINLMVS